ncbi:hypothetical protein FNW02_36230 [Komarekiella sp. 'clone 1']|uniref:Uncharacterized protein n=1 Tax=Komarekiella delphini-convector SJRDD-AB1 TaxID=2593771 RepID=A0AA40VVH7_9NOST|nr:hypothetical protein [Komarekiella delphini-convector]MBD6621029.1 hypothetical protein [Komarekiella delphini-convector SJRDD-AB1]
MIEKNIFEYGMNLLDSHFNKKLDDTVKGIWFEYLSDELMNEEFLTAVKNALLHSRFMPTAGELVGFIHGSKESKALMEWQVILKASTNCQDSSGIAYISTRARVALQAIGGLRTVGMAEEFRRNHMEKQFITVYCQCADKDAKALPQTSSAPTVEPKHEASESVPPPAHIRFEIAALKAKLSMNGKKPKLPS